MAYQNIGVPRFYINAFDFFRASRYFTYDVVMAYHLWAMFNTAFFDDSSLDQDSYGIFDTIPSTIFSARDFTLTEDLMNWEQNQPILGFPNSVNDPTRATKQNNFVAFLAHNMDEAPPGAGRISFDVPGRYASSIINGFVSQHAFTPRPLEKKDLSGHTNGTPGPEWEISAFNITRSGFTISTWDYHMPSYWNTNFDGFTVGSVVSGTYYDMQDAIDLSVSTNIEYGENKELTTNNGHSISNMIQNKPAKWGNAAPWTLYEGSPSANQSLSRSGRRTWDLKFSYMDDGSLWGSNQSISSSIPLNTTSGLDANDFSGGSGGIPLVGDIATIPPLHGYDNSSGGDAQFEDTATNNGFIGIHRYLGGMNYSYCGTPLAPGLNISTGLKYIVEFDLEFDLSHSPSSIGPYVDLKTTFEYPVEGASLTNEGPIRAEAGHVYMEFTTHSEDTSGTIVFNHDKSDNSAHCTITNLTLGVVNFAFLNETILTDDNFFSQVWHKTLGGTLPFIFQIDKDNNNPDQFAICKFKNNSLKATQTALNVYDISLSIEEVW